MVLTFDNVVDALAERGVTVTETVEGMDDRLGWYDHSSLTVGLHPDLLERQRLPVLLHEALHHWYQHDGHQSDAVERRIDERVATLLVSPRDYARAESQVGEHLGGLAAALDVPVWVVEAFQRLLARAA